MTAPPTTSHGRLSGVSRAVVPVAVALLALAYASGHLGWYRGTPLGQVPVMDEQENLMLGETIVRGELPKEPFYRAMGYPLLLAALRELGVETPGLFSATLVLGVLLHAINAALVAVTAQAWFGRGGGVGAGVLFALNPVLVHYATQALNATPALTLFLIGFASLAPEFTGAPHPAGTTWRWAVAGLAWAAAAMVRPNYLLAWCLLPLFALNLRIRRRRRTPLLAVLSGVFVFAAVAIWQWRVSGVPGFLPWQGTYNLWAANQPGTHGRYFVQRVSIPSSVGTLNPTRAESIYLYRQETGAAPSGPAELNAHWRRRFLGHITTDPLAWLGLLARKSYALVNDWEQYNNKTYAFHKARSRWLRWNPIGWGIMFALGVAGAARLRREQPRAAGVSAAIAGAVVASVLLFYVSARFRLPLVALATVLAGGAVAAPFFWRTWRRPLQLALGGAVLLAAGLAFSNWDRVRDRATFAEDHALLARAAERMGDFKLAWTEANAALTLNPRHRDSLRVAIVAYFNQLVRQQEPGDESQWREICRRFLALEERDATELQAIAIIAIWRSNQRVAAVEEWRRLGPTASAIAARLLVGDRSVTTADIERAPPSAWSEPLVRLAAAHFRILPPPGISPGDPDRAADILQRLFAPSSMRSGSAP